MCLFWAADCFQIKEHRIDRSPLATTTAMVRSLRPVSKGCKHDDDRWVLTRVLVRNTKRDDAKPWPLYLQCVQ